MKVGVDDSLAVGNRLNDPELKDETLMKYIYHPEYDLRTGAMNQVTKRGRADLVLPLLKSSDPRLRQAGLLALTGMFKGSPLPLDKITPEMFEEAGKMVDDPNESWWVVKHAIDALGRGTPELIAKHRDRLLQLLDYDCTWVQTAAVCTLASISTDPAHYKAVLPVILEKSAGFRVVSANNMSSKAISDAIKTASPQVKDFAVPLFKKTFAGIPGVIKEPNTGAVIKTASTVIRSQIGSILQLLPEGEQFVKEMPRTTLASFISGKDSDKYTYNGKFTPNKAMIGKWAWCIYPAPNKPSEVEPFISNWVNPKNGKAPAAVVANPKDFIELLDGGKVAKSRNFGGCFWSGDMMISMNEDQALKMEVRTIGGRDFLIVERGGFNAEPKTEEEATAGVSKDWHCGYHVYVRQ